MPKTGEFHADELRAAMDRSVGGPPAMGVCLDALRVAVDTLVRQQLAELQPGSGLYGELCARYGREGTAEEALDAIISGSFTLGMHVGLELERGRR